MGSQWGLFSQKTNTSAGSSPRLALFIGWTHVVHYCESTSLVICCNKLVQECKPSALWSTRGASQSSSLTYQQSQAAQARKGALWAFCVTPGNPWMFVMRPIIHSICSVSAESPHCSPTIELWGAFNPSASRGERCLFCDIMHSTNTLNESPLAHRTNSSVSKFADYKGVGRDTPCLIG